MVAACWSACSSSKLAAMQLRRQCLGDLGVGRQQLPERSPLVRGAHRAALDDDVGILA